MIFCINKNMSSFYLSDPKVLNELKLLDEDFRIYQHCCKQFNVKTLNSFVRVVDIAGQFQLTPCTEGWLHTVINAYSHQCHPLLNRYVRQGNGWRDPVVCIVRQVGVLRQALALLRL